VAYVTEVGQLAVLVGDISKALVDLGMPPIPGIPQDPGGAIDILEVVGTVLEHQWEASASDASPRD
jgi:hypothetical protein